MDDKVIERAEELVEEEGQCVVTDGWIPNIWVVTVSTILDLVAEDDAAMAEEEEVDKAEKFSNL